MTARLITDGSGCRYVQQAETPEPECPDCGSVVALLVVSVLVPDSDTGLGWQLVMVCTGCRTEVAP